jgi:flavin reductase (DIM6/NTAB) family NADH-FMN oxidoreductase RutF
MNKLPLMLVSNTLAIVSSEKKGRFNGLIVHALFQVSDEVPYVIMAINHSNLTYEYIQSSRAFTVSILEQQAPVSLINLFGFASGREIDKFAQVEYKIGQSGLPYICKNTLAYIEAHVMHAFNIGRMTLFSGRIIGTSLLKEGTPMSTNYYITKLNGSFPSTSTFHPKDNLYFG